MDCNLLMQCIDGMRLVNVVVGPAGVNFDFDRIGVRDRDAVTILSDTGIDIRDSNNNVVIYCSKYPPYSINEKLSCLLSDRRVLYAEVDNKNGGNIALIAFDGNRVLRLAPCAKSDDAVCWIIYYWKNGNRQVNPSAGYVVYSDCMDALIIKYNGNEPTVQQ